MTSIITGDIINSRKLPSGKWLPDFKRTLDTFGKSPADWEIYRGDEFQLEIKSPEEALMAALKIKAHLKNIGLDVRMSIGYGEKNHKAKRISESNGSAFIRSGEQFELLKKQKITLSLNTGNSDFDIEMNLMLRLGLSIMDNWLAQSAEFVLAATANNQLSQEELGQKLGINQAAVSRRRKRAHFDRRTGLLPTLDARRGRHRIRAPG